MSTKSYYLYKKQFSNDGSNWFDVQPLTYSYNGDGTQTPVVKEEHDAACGAISFISQYLTFESLEDNNFFIFNGNQQDIAYNRTVEYSTDGGQTWTSLYNGDSVTANSGDTIMWKATGLTPMIADGIGTFEGMNYYKVYGNIMSLVYGDDFAGQTTIGYYQFKNLFLNNTYLTDAENLILPSTSLTSMCYFQMFSGCTSLTTAPELPATSLATSCYYGMFQGCTSLITAPQLPAATLAGNCYQNMFANCSSLTSAPILPAMAMTIVCYAEMFSGCTSLTTAPELPATTLAQSCYSHMFDGCTSLTTAPSVLPATTLEYSCYANMFQDCTSLTSAPSFTATTVSDYCCSYMFFNCTSLTTIQISLSATTLANYCYRNMFHDCTSLTTAPELPATTLADECYSWMFCRCSSLITAPQLPATTLANGCYRLMFFFCTSLNYIKCLATNISATDCTTNWVNGVPLSGTFVKSASMSSWTTGVNGIPSGWTVQNA